MAKFAQRYALEREIGAGGMARVFLGRDEVLDRPVAIKILKPGYGGTDIGDRFQREGRTAARLSHPNVVSVYGAGEDVFEGREVSYIVMEYVPGGDLKALLDTEGPLPNARLARLGAEVSSGLAQAHEKGVIHRDIKPHNVLLVDSQGFSKLTDFGIARALDATQATQTGSYLGTALYSSPEQLQGEKVTPKSDVYSLGITLYQAATGETPFAGTPIEVASQHMNKTPAEPSALGANLSGMTEALILDCVRKDPGLRPTAEEVHDRFLDAEARAIHPARAKAPPPVFTGLPKKAQRTRAYSSETSTAKPPPGGAWHETDQSRRRRGLGILAVAALLLVLLGVATYAATREGGGSDTAQAPAPQEESQQAAPPENTEVQPAGGGGEGTVAGNGQEDTGAGDTGGGATKEAAEQTVRDFYQSAVDRDFGKHSGLMTPSWRQANFPEQGQFEGTYKTLKSIGWAEGPTAQVSGDTATVTGVTIASHTDRTERNSGTWRLVYENGEWRIDGWQIANLSTGPPQ